MGYEAEPIAEDSRPNYETSPERVQQLTSQLLLANADRLPMPDVENNKHTFVAIEVPGTSPYANIGRSIEVGVFEKTFDGNNAAFMVKEYGKYEESSRFFISVNQVTRQATGVLRVIHNSDAGLKSWDDAIKDFHFDTERANERNGLDDLDKVWDVGTIAVVPEFRGKEGPVSILLERAMYVAARDRGIEGLIAIIDKKALVKMSSTWRGVGIPFKRLPGTKGEGYIGSTTSYVVSGYVPEFYEKMSKHRQSKRGQLLAKYALGDALDRLIEGTGDEDILLSDDYKNQNA